MSRVERIAVVLVEHSYDHEVGECMCGYTFPSGADITAAVHVAEQIERAIG